MPTPVRVAICVATFMRPKYLGDLLHSIRGVDTQGLDAHLIVVDNDPRGSAEVVIQTNRHEFPMPITYEIEPDQGISNVRNRLINLALRVDADYLVFVDDDEVVTPGWLLEMTRVAVESGADGVSGRVRFVFEDGVAGWIRDGDLQAFRQPPLMTGKATSTTGTGNLMLCTASLARLGDLRFDARFNLTGGGDAHFLTRLRDKGGMVVAAPEAVVVERVPKSRTTWRWFMKRGFRAGVTQARILSYRNPTVRETGGFIVKSLALVAVGVTAALPVLVLRGRGQLLNEAWRAVRGVGRLAGLLGIQYREYLVKHGE